MLDNYAYNYGYGTPYGYGGSSLSLIGSGLVLAVGAFVGIYFILAWIFRSIGLYHLAKNRGIAHAWFAWVPILNHYIIGRLINNKVVLGDDYIITHASFWLPFLTFLNSSIIYEYNEGSWLFSIFTAIVWVLNISALWRLFKIYRPKNRVSFTIWSIFLTPGFFIFAIRDDKPFDELEPNKIYENYYGGKQVIDKEYSRERAEIRAHEKEQKEALRSDYEKQLNQDNLSTAQKDNLRENYYELRQSIKDEADNQIKQENRAYQQEIEALDQETKEHLDPVVTPLPDNDVEITPEVTEIPVEEEIQTQPIELGGPVLDEINITDTTSEEPTYDSFSETIDAINKFAQDQKSDE